MRARGAVFAALGGVAALLGWLAFGVGDRTEDPGEEAVSSTAEEPVAGAPEAGEVDLEPALVLESEEGETTRSAESSESEIPAPAPATAVAAASPDTALVRGVLRDAATGEPLPTYALRIQDSSGRREDLMTDESGKFATGSPMLGGTVNITPFDDPSHRRSLPVIAVERSIVAGEARDLELTVPCGPTYRFAFSPADTVVSTTLTASLMVRSLDDSQALGPEPLRAGDPAWVRFAPAPRDFDRCDRIDVRDKSGIWMGSARVSAIAGVVPGLVEVALEARAVLVGKAVDREGNPVRGAVVAFEGVASSGRTYERKASTRADGEFRMEFLAAGSGTVSVHPLRHTGRDAAVALVAGAVTRQDFLLEPLPPAGAISGIVESETGGYREDVEVVLRPLAGGANPEKRKVRWEEKDGRRVGAFEFEALPAGEYEVAVRGGDWFGWEPATLVASPPSAAARFRVHDDLAHADFAFLPRDRETGASLDAGFAWWSVEGGPGGSKRLGSGEKFLAKFPLDRSFHWRLDRRGYQPAFGDEKSFAIEEMHDGGVLKIAEVELAPGWGEVIRVVGRGKRKPIEGARILLDGREAGTTNRNGTCTVAAREKPKRVEIGYRDWVVASAIDLRPAWRRKEKRFVEIQVAPPARK